MITNAQPMACGACGHGLFRMFHTEADTGGFSLIAECNQCKSTSVIKPKPAELEIDWGEKSDGILCRMTPEST
jgi:hypothetical protein